MTIGTDLIQAERERQIEGEGFTSSSDDGYKKGELAAVACCYATPVKLYTNKTFADNSITFKDPYPGSWSVDWDKRLSYGNGGEDPDCLRVADPSSYTEEQRLDLLVKAGALIAAEIDRFGREYNKIIQPYYHRMKSIVKSDNPFCTACKEEHCCVDPDGTCEMIRIYLETKSELSEKEVMPANAAEVNIVPPQA